MNSIETGLQPAKTASSMHLIDWASRRCAIICDVRAVCVMCGLCMLHVLLVGSVPVQLPGQALAVMHGCWVMGCLVLGCPVAGLSA